MTSTKHFRNMSEAQPGGDAGGSGDHPPQGPHVAMRVYNDDLRWIRITASMAGLIGFFGLLALLAANARAQGNSGSRRARAPFQAPSRIRIRPLERRRAKTFLTKKKTRTRKAVRHQRRAELLVPELKS